MPGRQAPALPALALRAVLEVQKIFLSSFYFIMRGLRSTIGSLVKFILDNIFIVAIAAISGGALLWPALAPKGRRATALQVTQLINRGKTLVLDVRSADEFAARQLKAAGFEDVLSLEGGINAWTAAGLPVTK
jgi:hypothetical protein